jgi:hypothetical protein
LPVTDVSWMVVVLIGLAPVSPRFTYLRQHSV